MAHTVGMNFVASTRSKASKGVSFGEDEEERDEGNVIGWKLGFEGPLSEFGRCLVLFRAGGRIGMLRGRSSFVLTFYTVQATIWASVCVFSSRC